MRRVLLALALISPLLPVCAEEKRPNILFIFADDQSYKTVGCYPESWPWVKTPHIDALARSGVRFHAAYLGAWCMPSRASLLTGRHPHGIESMTMEGVYPGSTYDPVRCPFWPAVFRKNGYTTGQIGKWHTGTDAGWGRDWDYQAVWNRPKHPENAGAYYETQIVAFNGEEREVDGYPADNYTDWACDFIKGAHRDKAKPWYLWLCHGSIHGPSKPAKRHKGMYANAEVPLPKDILPPREGKPAYLNKTQSWTKDAATGKIVASKSGEKFGDESGKRRLFFDDWVRQMNECVPAVDESVGRVMEALRESGQLENTLVIYSADQGFGMGEHGFRTKLAPYDTNYRSPLIVAMPSRYASGKVCHAPVNAPDLVCTMLALAGVQVPWATHGRDLTPLLRDPATPWPHPCLYTHTGQSYGSDVPKVLAESPSRAAHNNVPWYAAIVSGHIKYIRYLATKEEELYDLKADPDELTNLAAQPGQETVLGKMRGLMAAELKRCDASF